ncbi:MAG: hypothetical protein KBD16_00770 [Candidatus Pacebacteria bacterium]|nr:hypothetical protein [Candidatus Paceibacterota bacterium]
MDIIKFDPSIEHLNKIVEATSKITADDLSDDTQLYLVKETRLNLRTARTTIEKQGKSMREEAVKYQKDVIAREKELIAIIEPEEKRLKALEDEAALIKVREARKELLPMRRSMLVGLMNVEPTDEYLLEMSNDEFISFLNDMTAAKNERDRLEIEQEKAKLADAARLEQVRKDAEVAERSRIEANQKAEEQRRIEVEAQRKIDAEAAAKKIVDDAKAEAERIEKEARDNEAARVAREEAQKREDEVRAQQQRDKEAAQAANEKYLAWAKEQGWTPELAAEFKTEHIDGSIVLWKKVGVYKLGK